MKNDTVKRFGYEPAELFGILLMLVAVIIALTFRVPGKTIGFITIKKAIDIKPDFASAMVASVFYVGLVARYGIFRRNGSIEPIISTIQAGLNILAISSLVVAAVGHIQQVKSIFDLGMPALWLIAGLITTWLGMRAVAGYSWIFFIAAAFNQIATINKAMDLLGAIYVVCIALSLLLQVKDLCKISEFMDDFRGSAKRYEHTVKENINIAVEDAENKAQAAVEFAARSAGVPVPPANRNRPGMTNHTDQH